MSLAAAPRRSTQEHGAFRRRPPAEALRRRLALSFPSSCALCVFLSCVLLLFDRDSITRTNRVISANSALALRLRASASASARSRSRSRSRSWSRSRSRSRSQSQFQSRSRSRLLGLGLSALGLGLGLGLGFSVVGVGVQWASRTRG